MSINLQPWSGAWGGTDGQHPRPRRRLHQARPETVHHPQQRRRPCSSATSTESPWLQLFVSQHAKQVHVTQQNNQTQPIHEEYRTLQTYDFHYSLASVCVWTSSPTGTSGGQWWFSLSSFTFFFSFFKISFHFLKGAIKSIDSFQERGQGLRGRKTAIIPHNEQFVPRASWRPRYEKQLARHITAAAGDLTV